MFHNNEICKGFPQLSVTFLYLLRISSRVRRWCELSKNVLKISRNSLKIILHLDRILFLFVSDCEPGTFQKLT